MEDCTMPSPPTQVLFRHFIIVFLSKFYHLIASSFSLYPLCFQHNLDIHNIVQILISCFSDKKCAQFLPFPTPFEAFAQTANAVVFSDILGVFASSLDIVLRFAYNK